MTKDDLICFTDDEAEAVAEAAPWIILVVDDEEQVHHATTYALAGIRILGRPLRFVHATSGAEARKRLAEEPGIAVILLDVVMEAEDAGLRLVEHIRVTLSRPSVRIILRTGQPGYAPELEVIQRYDINDYRTKSELTHLRLVTALTSALRSYQQIEAIDANRRGLEKIIAASSDLIARRSLPTFAEGVLTQLCGLKGLAPEGVIVARLNPSDSLAHRASGEARVVAAAGRYASFLGRAVEEIPAEVLSVMQRAEALQSIQTAARTATLPLRLASGEAVTVYCELEQPLTDADRQLLEVFAANIAVGFDNACLFEDVKFLAFHDTATGLLNRAGFLRCLQAKVNDVRTVAVLELDDHRSLVNSGGDGLASAMLKGVARRLTDRFPEAVVGMVGEASFGIAVADAATDPQAIATEVKRAAELPVDTPQGSLIGCATVGFVAVDRAVEGQGDTADCLLRAGGVALQEAKRRGRGAVARHEGRLAEELVERLGVLSGWNRALEAGQLEVHYQPQIALSTGRMVGAEALLRWRRPDGSYLSPGVFIPIAEESGIIVEIGNHVLDLVCGQIVAWRSAGFAVPPIGVNVSVRQLMLPGFADSFEERLRRNDLPAEQLKLEVTESAFAPDLGDVRLELQALRSLGMPIAIDDFGTGYSSLGQLHGLPVDELKLDRELIQGLDHDGRRAEIVSLVANFGRRLGMTVLAEGIETEAEAREVRALGVPLAQGYFFGRPCGRDSFSSRLVPA